MQVLKYTGLFFLITLALPGATHLLPNAWQGSPLVQSLGLPQVHAEIPSVYPDQGSGVKETTPDEFDGPAIEDDFEIVTGVAQNTVSSLLLEQNDAPLQFTTDGGQVLGFQSNSIMVASMDHMLRVDLVGANPVMPVPQDGASETRSSMGTARPFTPISYPNVWEGVTAVYEAKAGAILKSTYYVDAGLPGNPVEQIRLRYNRDVSLDEQGNLVLAYEHGTLTDSAPLAWQKIDGRRQYVEVSYVLLDYDEVGFSVGDYDHSRALVIDPTLTWSTFLGAAGNEEGRAIAVDGSGNVYVSGTSSATWGSPILPHSGGGDAFVAKLNSSGDFQWNTFLGGSGSDTGSGIAVDSSDNVYVSGTSNAAWGSPVGAYTGGYDIFAAKLNSSGALQWNAFLGSSSTDFGYTIAVDGSSNVYLSGASTATWGSPVRAYTAGYEAFVAKLNSSGAFQWNTFLGGSGLDDAFGIVVDSSGNVYLNGRSNATWGSPVRAYTAGYDAFVAKLNNTGALEWNSFLGGSGSDYGYATIGVDSGGNLYVGGYSSATWGSPVRAYTAGNDTYAAKLNSSGDLQWSTFLGGSATDYCYGMAVDSSGNAYLTGYSSATWGSPVVAYTGGGDAWAAEITSSGDLQWNTFLGGSGIDYGRSIALDSSKNIYVAGYSNATWGSPVQPFGGGQNDAFATKIEPDAQTLAISGTVFEDADFSGTASAYDGGANDLALANVDVELYDGADAYIASTVTAGDGSFSFSPLAGGNYKVRVRSATIGGPDTPPAGGLNTTVPGTWPYPLSEMTWGHTAAMIGGQDATVDDTDIGDNSGPGDTYVAVTVSGAAVTGVNLGFTYNLIVNTLDDGNADNLRSDQGSLRQFIKNTNAIGAAGGTNANSSEFHIQVATNQSSGADTWWRISPITQLPVLEDSATVVNGATQTANGGDNNSRGPEIEIDGASIPTTAGLTVTTADVWIHGIVLNGFTTAPGVGILVDGASAIGNRITGCYIGTNAVGDAELPNFYGITLSNGTSGTLIGEAGEGNVISGSNFYGIEFDNAGANTTIQGNRIGTNAMGDGVFANAQGLYIDGGSAIVIGGPGAGEGNLISGNVLYGINLQVATDVTIQGNWMGLNQAGTDPLPDGGTAIFGGGASNDVTIGGPAPGEGNIIAGNDGNGIAFQQGCHHWVIQGNTIGTGPLGTETNLGNTGAANLRVTTNDITINAKIGGDNPGEGNLIAFASGPGIDCVSLGSAVEITGNVIRDNGEEGIVARVDSVIVAGNEIYNNGAGFDGILIMDVASDGKVYHNTIHGSGSDGIEIVGMGHEIRNNIITGSTGYGINLNGGSMTESNNLVTGTATIQANVLGRSNVALDGSDLDADPSYIDAAGGDFSLTECSSPAINAGLDLGVDQPDMNGIDPGNYNGPVPDMGALETSCVAGSYEISGTVFEDVNFGGGTGVDHATALARAGTFTLERAGVTVELYDSGGNHVSAVSPQTTDASGNYGFTGLAPDSYTVRVVNSSVTSIRAGSDGSELGVQTYRIDGDGEPIGTGASKVGGEVPADEDAAANSGVQTLTSLQGTDLDTDGISEWTQSIVTVDASGGDVTGVDFGFNFGTIVNTNDKDQGSLRQFIQNANLLTDQASLAQNGLTAGAETSIFMIPSSTDPLGRLMDPGFDAGRGVAVIAPVSEMVALVDSGTFLDGTTQTVNIGDTNPGVLGYVGPVGLGADGVIATGDEPTLSGVAAPEIEVQGNSTLEFGLRLQGSDITLRGLAVYGFGISGLDANILVGHHSLETNNTNCRIEANVLGTMADSFTDPGLGVRSPTINIYVRTADQGTIVGNLLGFVGRENVRILSTALNWQVTDNEIRAGGRETTFGGVTYIADATGELKRNLIADDNATAVLGINTDLEIEDNTISGNLGGAIGFFDNSGSMVTTASVLQNDLTGNGSGVVVFGENGASPAITGIRISRNRFSQNTWNAIDLATSWSADGISVNDGTQLGDSSVPNSCGTVLTWGNIGLDAPLVDSANLSAGTTTIIGRACPGAEIEIYRAVADGDASDTAGGTDYGEGVEYLDTATADGAGDWTIMTTALADGNHVSAIAIDALGNTSEFGPNLVVTAIGLSGIVFEDADFAGTATDYDGGVADLPIINVDVELYNGTTDAYIASTTTTTGGIFTFGTLADGTYKVRVRSETLGDTDTPPASGLNAPVPGTWPYPLPEMSWGNGSALIGGQDHTVDDTATGDNAGPGDTYVTVTVSGADLTGVNFGFCYELIVNQDDDANPDNVRSKQGTLRQFIKNSNAIAGVNKSWFQIPGP